ncbi:MAG TPA: hypothetical protein VF042_14790 [Gemmatimonadaceae bacterium]
MPTRLSGPDRCRRKFLKFFPDGFRDETYIDWERDYKWEAHERWNEQLSAKELRSLIQSGEHTEVARRAVTIESRTNLLFSFEKMAMRDAVKPEDGAVAFAEGLYEFLHGRGTVENRFNRWVEVVGTLPRKQTRVLTWPVVTVFGFIAQPDTHVFLKPMVTKRAAEEYGVEFLYRSRPNWETYQSLLDFAKRVARDVRDLHPKDLIDIQGVIWVQGSDEYD